MTATLPVARDDIMEQFDATWAPTGNPVHYPGIADKDFPPATQIPWARVMFLPTAGNQVTLSGIDGQRRFRHVGVVTAQVFTPLGDGGRSTYALAQTIMDGFQGFSTANGVEFRNVRANTIGPSRDWFQVNVLIDYEYDEIT